MTQHIVHHAGNSRRARKSTESAARASRRVESLTGQWLSGDSEQAGGQGLVLGEGVLMRRNITVARMLQICAQSASHFGTPESLDGALPHANPWMAMNIGA